MGPRPAHRPAPRVTSCVSSPGATFPPTEHAHSRRVEQAKPGSVGGQTGRAARSEDTTAPRAGLHEPAGRRGRRRREKVRNTLLNTEHAADVVHQQQGRRPHLPSGTPSPHNTVDAAAHSVVRPQRVTLQRNAAAQRCCTNVTPTLPCALRVRRTLQATRQRSTSTSTFAWPRPSTAWRSS